MKFHGGGILISSYPCESPSQFEVPCGSELWYHPSKSVLACNFNVSILTTEDPAPLRSRDIRRLVDVQRPFRAKGLR